MMSTPLRHRGDSSCTCLAMRPTGNCSPALEDLLTCFLPAVLPLPRPAPDMLAAVRGCGEVCLFRAACFKQVVCFVAELSKGQFIPGCWKLLMLPHHAAVQN